MARDSTETRRRILEAAYREFARHGLAGARVDRIAAAAQANKRAIYDYFGNKQQLFDVVVVDRLVAGITLVPQSWDDLPQYGGDVLDYYDADPDRARLTLWRQLERPEAIEGEAEAFREKLASLRKTRTGADAIDPADLYAIIWALYHTVILYPQAMLAAAGTQPGERLPQLRAGIVEAVRRITDSLH
jgi:AcrR family transcriptional regulator